MDGWMGEQGPGKGARDYESFELAPVLPSPFKVGNSQRRWGFSPFGFAQ